MVFFIVNGCTRLHLRRRGRCPRKPLPAERARGRGVFHGITRFAGLARGLTQVGVFFFLVV